MKKIVIACCLLCMIVWSCNSNAQKGSTSEDTIPSDTTIVSQNQSTGETLLRQRIEDIYADVLAKRNERNYPIESDLPYLSLGLKELWKSLPTDEESDVNDLWVPTLEWDSLSLKTIKVLALHNERAFADVIVTSHLNDGQTPFDIPVRLSFILERQDGQEPQWFLDDSGKAGEQIEQLEYSVRQQLENR